jgi:hypothetical protein
LDDKKSEVNRVQDFVEIEEFEDEEIEEFEDDNLDLELEEDQP